MHNIIGNVLTLLLLEIQTASLLMIKILVAHIRDLYLFDRNNRECWYFCSEHESNDPIPRVFSHWTIICVSECTTQAPFSNNKLCCFHIRQWVRVGTVEPVTVNTKWASDTFAYRNLSQKPFGHPLGIYVLANWFSVKVHYSIIYFCCSTFGLSELILTILASLTKDVQSKKFM